MKTSDKLLLCFSLSALVLYGAVHLGLYARSRDSKAITRLRQAESWTVQYKGKAPASLSLQGNVNITLIPSDSFFIKYDNGDKGKIELRGSGTDSLSIRGGAFSMNPHDIFQRYSDYPWIEIHAGPQTLIRLNNLLALVKGPKITGRSDWNLEAINTQIWIGEGYGNENNFTAAEFYDHIQLNATNSNLVLHRNAVVGELNVQLDDQSELNDQHANIRQPEIHYTDGSRINLTGATLDRLRKMNN
ncbi:MAG TPA: hypothetical protein VNS58_29270 [Puia sp.]|nr:hypothetical protein [Puia sp.]